METTLQIALIAFIALPIYFLHAIRRKTKHYQREQLENMRRKRMIRKELTLSEGSIKWN
jgi:hypothetical protein